MAIRKGNTELIVPCSSTYRDTCKAGGFEGAILGPENAHASGFNIACLHSIIRMQSAHMPCPGGRADSAMYGHVAASYVQAFSLV